MALERLETVPEKVLFGLFLGAIVVLLFITGIVIIVT